MQNNISLVDFTHELNNLARIHGYGLTSVTASCGVHNNHHTGEPGEPKIELRGSMANTVHAISFDGPNALEIMRKFREHFNPTPVIKTDDVEFRMAA